MKWIALPLLVAMLAGCSDDKAGGESPVDDPTAESLEAPTWVLGQSWTYTTIDDEVFDVVVALDAGADWELHTNDIEVAWYHFGDDISYLGKVRKSDLAGSQGSERVKFFDFPLEHEKTWSTTWDGESVTLTAHGVDAGFHIVAMAGEAMFAEYTYSREAGFFDSLMFYNLTTGDEQWGLELTGTDAEFTGNVYRYVDQEVLYDVEYTTPGATTGTINIDDETELLISVAVDCDDAAGAMGAGLQPPDENGNAQPGPPSPVEYPGQPDVKGYFGFCPIEGGSHMSHIVSPAQGAWRLDVGVVGQGLVTLFIETRTVETIVF